MSLVRRTLLLSLGLLAPLAACGNDFVRSADLNGGGFAAVTTRLAVEAVRAGDFGRAKELIASLEPNRYQAFLRPAGLAWLRLADGEGPEAALAALESLAPEPGF